MSTASTASTSETAGTSSRRGGGRVGRKALRGAAMTSFPTLVLKITFYEIVPDEAVDLIHNE